MCRDCGCSSMGLPKTPPPRKIDLGLSVLAKNDRLAGENRRYFEENKMRVLNLISSPGSGKTLLLEKTVAALGTEFPWVIVTGDQEQDFDAQRLQAVASGSQVAIKQLNTGSACHLDSAMIQKELGQFIKPSHRLVVIENVGNLVCPAAFDLGEKEKIALLSTTEGEDKPSKYPLLFREASLIVLTKVDLIPHLDWNLELCEQHIRRVNAHAPILRVSARTGEGMKAWFDFVREGQGHVPCYQNPH